MSQTRRLVNGGRERLRETPETCPIRPGWRSQKTFRAVYGPTAPHHSSAPALARSSRVRTAPLAQAITMSPPANVSRPMCSPSSSAAQQMLGRRKNTAHHHSASQRLGAGFPADTPLSPTELNLTGLGMSGRIIGRLWSHAEQASEPISRNPSQRHSCTTSLTADTEMRDLTRPPPSSGSTARRAPRRRATAAEPTAARPTPSNASADRLLPFG